MHRPDGELKDCDITPFMPALECACRPSTEYDTARWLFVPNHYAEYRYILGTRGVNPLICIGINPSTAAPDRLDNTLKSVERIALGNGYDSFIMFNVYARRATNPGDMEQQANALLHQENLRAFEYVLSLAGSRRPAVWAAWGTIIETRDYLRTCLADMIEAGEKHNAQWFSAGLCSRKGHPHHPLYLRKDCRLDTFPIREYSRAVLDITCKYKLRNTGL